MGKAKALEALAKDGEGTPAVCSRAVGWRALLGALLVQAATRETSCSSPNTPPGRSMWLGGDVDQEVEEHLLRFFRGCFWEVEEAAGLSRGREPEDVVLRWAYGDQYYIDSLGGAARRAAHPSRTGKQRPGNIPSGGDGRFIHRDLGAYLRRALGAYIASEVLRLDEDDPAPEEALAKAQSVRQAAMRIIDWLAEAEEVAKRLWLKKKLVTKCRYLIRLDLVPAEFFREIRRNRAQVEEWRELLGSSDGEGIHGEPLSDFFLRAHPTLTLDTGHFDEDFTTRLLEAIGDIEELLDGILVQSENFQALSLLEDRFRRTVDCVYIDPPYNTGNGSFVYHDRFRHSAWLTMMRDRLELAQRLLRHDGALFVSIDGNERDRLALLGEQTLGLELLNTFVWVNNLKGRQITGRGAAGTHEYVLAFGSASTPLFTIPVEWAKRAMPSAYRGFRYRAFEDEHGLYVLKNELYNTNSRFNEETRPNLVFHIHYNPETREIRFSNVNEDVEYPGFVKIPPHRNRDGKHRFHAWRWSRERILAEPHNLAFVQKGGRWRVYTKVRGFSETHLKDIVTDISTSDGTRQLTQLFGHPPKVDYPKPVELVRIFVQQAPVDGWVLDFFAGSGTTGHAVIDANREEGSRRKFILVEMGDHFDTVLLPRLKKVVLAPEWKDGRLVRMPTAEEVERSPRLLKVLRLESYEDALENLELDVGEAHEEEGESAPGRGDEAFILRYVVDRGDGVRLDLPALHRIADPTSYRLRRRSGGGGEAKDVPVDLVETFHWLLGLRVRRMWAPRRFRLDGEIRWGTTGVELVGRLVPDADGPYWFRAVEGELPEERRALVIWRKLGGVPEEDDLLLEEWLRKEGVAARLSDVDVVYVNGSTALDNLKAPGDRWTVRLTEEEFFRRMFDVRAPEGGCHQGAKQRR